MTFLIVSAALLILLLLMSAWLAVSYVSLSEYSRQSMKEAAESNKRARIVLSSTEDNPRMLEAIALANLVTLFLFAGLLTIVASTQLAQWLGQTDIFAAQAGVLFFVAPLIVLPIAGYISYLLAEVLPRHVALLNSEAWALRVIGVGRLLSSTLGPLVTLGGSFAKLVVPPPSDRDRESSHVIEEKIMTLVEAGEEEGSIEQEERDMIYSIFQLDETWAREIMVPRIDIAALEVTTPLLQARRMIVDAGHSRVPVFDGSLDHIKGLLYAKDLLALDPSSFTDKTPDLTRFLRPALFIPESKRVSDLLRELQNRKVHMAIVIDEYGGTAGLVTIEDIVEEIVGEIRDEYDFEEEAAYQTISEGEFIFDARIDLDDFNRLLGVDLPADESDTLGGFIYEQLGRVPIPGEEIKTPALHMRIQDVEDQRIGKVRVERVVSSQDEPAERTKERSKGGEESDGS
ncbi:MAG: HlyC/CorC family transporter [Chloroflexi bacterium]|nr:HlyC/CorC family transporter [Chloroflexota bacterium]